MTKRLYKSRNRMLFGVCGGFAEYFGIDPTLVRLGLVILCIFAGTGFFAYLVCAFIIPERPFADDFDENIKSTNEYDRTDEEFDRHFQKEKKKDKN